MDHVHNLFNSLNSIMNYIKNNQPDDAEVFLIRFSKLMRIVLEQSEKEYISIGEEINTLKNYIELEKGRLQHTFECNISVDESMDIENTLLPPLILQPFVENSIWHGIAHMSGKGAIDINITSEGQIVKFTVKDNGTARSFDTQKNTISLGIKITKERIKMMDENNIISNPVSVQDEKTGYISEIFIPLKLNY
ncbi:MAG: hypothetical protein EOO43_06595 [Flavobacterium sp.]|nr:MAG: hypothetical protein EOO43_06595 [Flavobacterium sp.]